MSRSKNFLIKKIMIFMAMLIIIFISGCGNSTTDYPDNYGDVIAAAAYITDPVTENMTGTISFDEINPPQTNSGDGVINDASVVVSDVPQIITAAESTTETAELFAITPSGKKYHTMTCRYAKTANNYISREEAEQSKYEACKVCNP